MDGCDTSSDQIIAELVDMGFEFSDILEAIKVVGASLGDAINFILNGSGSRKNSSNSTSSKHDTTPHEKAQGKRPSSPSGSDQMRQSTIMEHHNRLAHRSKRSRKDVESEVSTSGLKDAPKEALECTATDLVTEKMSFPYNCSNELVIQKNWEQEVNRLLKKHFSYSSLKSFQNEALAAWIANRDCLVLAATGSGIYNVLLNKIPALLTGKVVVVISPLISLMHDQCLKLAKHGVSSCFLGSGQTDKSIEQKAMKGMYSIIYVCPETVLRLIKPLQSLAEGRGIALFAIDEVHCISKWGHDFRPAYRRLAILRENFRADNLKFLKFDVPLMALTATATIRVRDDILKSLCMSNESKTVITSFFRPNLRFSVRHSRTSSSSYGNDFRELIDMYTQKTTGKKKQQVLSKNLDRGLYDNSVTLEEGLESDVNDADGYSSSDCEDEVCLMRASGSTASTEKKLTVDFLEDEYDIFHCADDLDVPCSEFVAQPPLPKFNSSKLSRVFGVRNKEEEDFEKSHIQGPTIIYVPTRKETVIISKFLCKSGVKAAPYNAKLTKQHLRRVHTEFHDNRLEVVVSTIAFGMGIDKSNVRRIIHYGWPQSLEAYYQEAGRAGRDGKLADCILYANLSRTPTLLPSIRSEDQTRQAYEMLSECFRYGMKNSICRSKLLVEYFGEKFNQECHVCDVCTKGPPEMLNVMDEIGAFMQVLAEHYEQGCLQGNLQDDIISGSHNPVKYKRKPDVKIFVSKIREQFQKFTTSDNLWWQGLARILQDKGFIKEEDEMVHVQIKYPEPTKLGLEWLQQKMEQYSYVYPEADMLLSMANPKPYSSFSEWGKGWADPEIRRQRLSRNRFGWKQKKRKSSKQKHPDSKILRRLASLSKRR